MTISRRPTPTTTWPRRTLAKERFGRGPNISVPMTHNRTGCLGFAQYAVGEWAGIGAPHFSTQRWATLAKQAAAKDMANLESVFEGPSRSTRPPWACRVPPRLFKVVRP